ncbi:hypothetical protein [Flavobacterium fryxellicola]|uniref:hypothetical protein n=1 Tax=Flavobacterium fryxellicola TaxID=249352 RepID=UPI000A45CA85|nr:hypothetical protein [Flavobacterium fryxellicola]
MSKNEVLLVGSLTYPINDCDSYDNFECTIHIAEEDSKEVILQSTVYSNSYVSL